MRAAYLIGFRGCGKTTLGRRAAADLEADFLDLDEIWERENGRSILDFVEERGLQAFRESEQALLARVEAGLARRGPTLVATGGGIVVEGGSREILARSPAPKIYLAAPAPELWRRLREHPERLQIGHLQSEGELAELLARRAPLYAKIATVTLPNRSISESLNELKQALTRIWGGA